MAFTTVSIDPNNIDAAPGPYQHQILNANGTTRYLCAYNFSTGFSIYKSTDSGATWNQIDSGDYPASISDNCILQTQLIVGGGTSGDLIRVTSALPRTTGTYTNDAGIIEFCDFDTGALTWSGPTNIGGGFNPHTHSTLGATDSASVYRFKRNDGSTIVIYQAEWLQPTPPAGAGAAGANQVRVLKLVGSTWTQLAAFATEVYIGPGSQDWETRHYTLWSAVMDGFGNTHLFLGKQFVPVPSGGSDYTTADLVHYSISSSDAVSSEHLVDSNLETMPATSNPGQPTSSSEPGRSAVKPDNTEVAFGYGWKTFTFAPSGTGCEVHVARGDMSGDPLNPTFIVDVVATNEPNWGGPANDVHVTYDNPAKIALEYFGSGVVTVGYGEHALANLKVYWATLGASNKGKIRLSQFDGVSSWTAAAQLWPDPDSSAVSLDGFDVGSTPPTPIATISIACPIAPLTAQVGVPYASDAPVVSGDTPPDTFVLLSGPPWMTINALTGVVSGTPTAEGLVTYTIQVTDSLGHIAVVDAPCPLTVSNPIPPPPVCEQVPATGPETLVLYNEPLEQQGT